jgi:methionine-rich copper-binding protein CopC
MLAHALRLPLVLSFVLLSCGVVAARQMRVQESYPAAETIIDGRNAQYLVRFDGPVDHRNARLEIIRDGKVIEELHPRLDSAPDVLFASAPALSPGHYVFRWSVKSAPDNEVTEGEIRFSVAG